MGIIREIGATLKRRSINRSTKVALPDREVHIWELSDKEVIVVEKKPGGAFIEFHVENKPYGRVKGAYKRRATLSNRRGNHAFL